MKYFIITYDDGYNYNTYKTYAKKKCEAIRDFKNSVGSRYKIIEVEVEEI